jgi:AcrR family transcriptional regulator
MLNAEDPYEYLTRTNVRPTIEMMAGFDRKLLHLFSRGSTRVCSFAYPARQALIALEREQTLQEFWRSVEPETEEIHIFELSDRNERTFDLLRSIVGIGETMVVAESLLQKKVVAPAEESDTRSRILETATRLFKAKGFSGVGIREIAQAADVHLAAVNYHFRNKENLWEEALRFYFRFSSVQAADLSKLLDEARQADSAEAILDILQRAMQRMLEDLRDPERESGSLLMWEMASNGQHLEMIMREYLQPSRRLLREMMRLLLPTADQMQLDLWVTSVVGQCVSARQSLPLTKIFLNLETQEECVLVVIKQTIDFCMSAIRGYIKDFESVRDVAVPR